MLYGHCTREHLHGLWPDSIHDIVTQLGLFQELLLHAMTTAAAFVLLEFFEKGLEVPCCSAVEQLLEL